MLKGYGISKDQRTKEGVPCILYGELYTTYKSEIIQDVVSRTDVQDEGLVNSKENDVIIPSSGETAADIATARCVLTSNVLLGGDLNIIRLRGNDGRFLCYELNGRRRPEIAKIAQGVSVVHLYADGLKRIKIHMPTLPEQRKIAGFLSLLDERIAVQRALIGEMGRLMGGIREWLFAHTDGKCVRLADVCKIVKGQQVNKQELNESGPYYVMNGGTTPSGYYSKSNTGTGVISISEGGNSCGYVQWNENPFWSGGHCYTIVDISKDAVPHFLYQYLKHKESDIMKLRIGSGLPNIQKKTLECFTVKLPSFTEQTKISTALKAVDLRAKNAEELLRLLLKQKSFFLQKLFI